MGEPPGRPHLVLTGCTATGKKEVGLEVARRLGAEIVGMDSIKVYRGLSIGAAAAEPAAPGDPRLHLVGIADPTRPFSVGRWVDAARDAAQEIERRGARVLFLGGTPLYLRALLRGFFQGPPAQPALRERLESEAAEAGVDALHERLRTIDPDAAERIFRGDLKRICRALEVFEVTGRTITALQREGTERPFDRELRAVGLRVAPELHRRRIEERVDRMIARGLVGEVRDLLARGALAGEAANAIGYRETAAHLRGELSLEAMREAIVVDTRQLVRKQNKWFRRFPEVTWIDRTAGTTNDELVRRVVEAFERPASRDADA
ncbi:MAG: tRNA (adenosine(37)-N6)-dimethylallyltransferase MiaA [Planctomycetota bacterium JB042]